MLLVLPLPDELQSYPRHLGIFPLRFDTFIAFWGLKLEKWGYQG